MAAPRTVLIVEDESIIAHDLQQTLIGLGYNAFGIASSAEEALARAAERRPDIALVDIRIKGKLDGIQTAQLLQEGHGVPIVYMTAHTDDATIARAARTRPYGYLHKPVRPAELKSVIEIALFNHAEQPRNQARSEGRSPVPAASAAAPRPATSPTPTEVRRQLERALQSADLDASRRSREFLCFIVEETLAGRAAELTQAAIATRVFGRKDDFDALLDPIVRIQAGRLRRSLERYYLLGGKQDAIRIDLPRGAYVPSFGRVDVPRPAGIAPAVSPPAPDPGDSWPSVVVRPFEGASSEAGLEDVALTLQDELTLELGRHREARVLLQRDADRAGHSPPPRFELAGRLRREDGAWRVSARLVDRTTGERVWGDEYHTEPRPGRWSGTLDDIARVIAAQVSAEDGAVVRALSREYRKRPAASAGAYGAILRAQHFFLARDVHDLFPAVKALRQVVAAEPEISLAWANLARLYVVNHALELSDLDTPIDDAITFAHQGVRLDPSAPKVRSILASALLIKGGMEAGREELDAALRLNPGSLVYLEIIGWLMALLGSWERGVALMRSAMERNPHHLPHVHHGLWAHHLRRGEYEEAYRAALEYRDPTSFWRSLMRASALGHLGRTGEARAEVAELLRQKPSFADRGRTLIGRYIKAEDLQQRVADGLRKAGLALH